MLVANYHHLLQLPRRRSSNSSGVAQPDGQNAVPVSRAACQVVQHAQRGVGILEIIRAAHNVGVGVVVFVPAGGKEEVMAGRPSRVLPNCTACCMVKRNALRVPRDSRVQGAKPNLISAGALLFWFCSVLTWTSGQHYR
jgi:hypothetical protein